MRAIADYQALIPPANAGKPKFMATVAATVAPFAGIQSAAAAIPSQFDLDAAIGVQLDAVGLWVGRSRVIPIPIANPWMSLDDAVRCLDRAPLYVPGITAGNTYTSLDDDTYRRLLRAKIAANYWDGTAADAGAVLAVFFQPPPSLDTSTSGAIGIGSIGSMTIGVGSGPTTSTYIFVQDNGDMSMTIGVAGIVPPIVDLEIIGQNLIPVKPQGVELDVWVTSVSGAPVFGLDVENQYIAGCDVGALGVTPDYAAQNIS